MYALYQSMLWHRPKTEEDLLAALIGDQIAGATLDVLNQEPPAAEHSPVNYAIFTMTA